MKTRILLIILTFFLVFTAKSFTFEEAKKTVIEKNRGLKISRIEVAKAESKMKESWASFYPTINLQSSYTRMLGVPQFEMETPAGTQYIPMGYPDNYRNSLQVTFPIFTFGKRIIGKEIARRAFHIQEFQKETDKMNLLKDLSTIFYGVVSAKEGLKISKEAIKRAKEHLETVSIQFDRGRVTKLDMLTAETELNKRKTEYLTVKNGLKKAQSALNILLGFPVDTLVDIEAENEVKQHTFILDSLVQKAIEMRPEVSSIEELNKVANLNKKMQFLNYLPTIVFSGNFSYDKPSNMKNEWDNNITATIALSMPIFNGFSKQRQIEQHTLTSKQSNIREKIIKESIKMEIKNFLLDYRLNKEKLILADKELERSRETYKMAKEQYERGYITSLDYKDIELGYRSAELSYLNASYNLSVSLSHIMIATMTEQEEK